MEEWFNALYYYGYKEDLYQKLTRMLHTWCNYHGFNHESSLRKILTKILSEKTLTEQELALEVPVDDIYNALRGMLNRVGVDMVHTAKCKLLQYDGKYMSDITLLENHWSEL